jgi:cell division protein FtsQ
MVKQRIIHISKIVALVVLIIGSIGFVEKKYSGRLCKAIKVDIDNQFENYFINEADIIDIITNRGERRVVGEELGNLNLKEIERKLLDHKFVQEADVYKDLKGNINVMVNQSRPIARLTSPSRKDRYISDRGEILPVSNRYTARVVLISGYYAEKADLESIMNSEFGEKLLALLHFIEHDKFWKSQIAEMHIDKKGEITMYSQISKQKVEFGQPDNIERKFVKLKIFYKDILPTKGWNDYDRVCLKYKNQIVCE